MSQDLLNTSALGASGFSGRSGEIGYGGNRLNTAAGGMNDYMDDGNWQQQHQPQYDPGYAARQEQDAAYMQYQQRMQEQQAAADAAAGYYGSQYVYPEPQNGYYTNQIYSHDDGRHLYQGTHGYDVGSGQAYNDNTHVTGTQASPHMDMDPSQHQLYNNSIYGGAMFPAPTDAPTSQYIYPESDTRYTGTGSAIPDSATRLDAAQSEGQQGTSMGPTSGNPKTANSPQRIPSARRGPQALYQESEPATR
ncbi:hypothetical protein BG011_000777 [Mortierella polycephala]|uniref:Uncharacterized protein n=1 Tax=Mortierella polycephala TaxID=41804 RepID=A0A9P6Q6E9_9FUNG|nr:hypothetical protein BG011_000777 [Mortierella polycephala]